MKDGWIYRSGIASSVYSCGLKKTGQYDLALLRFPKPACWTGCFTQNRCAAAPIIYAKSLLKQGKDVRLMLINSGNANAATGREGLDDIKFLTKRIEALSGIDSEEIIVSSTGVIGEPLPKERISAALPELLQRSSGFEDSVADAIMTTDTKRKISELSFYSHGQLFHIWAMAKGSGMIFPHLATMLVFIITDFPLSEWKGNLLKDVVDESFNKITVDGDMSTNDSVFLFSIGENAKANKTDFKDALMSVAKELSEKIVEDGEGAHKIVNVVVKNASGVEDAKKAASKIANSELVKTAIYGEDPNWGRVYAALGASGASFDPLKVSISFDDKPACRNGKKAKDYSEEALSKIMKHNRFSIIIDLNAGDASYNIFTTDLSYEYIKINASYRS